MEGRDYQWRGHGPDGDAQRRGIDILNGRYAAPAGDRADHQVALPKPEEAVFAPDAWDDDLALSIVVTDFERASQHRQQNFDLVWDDCDRLLHANVTQRRWEGTDTPRSSLGVK